MKSIFTIVLVLIGISIHSQQLPDEVFDQIHLLNGEVVDCEILNETKKLIEFNKIGDTQRYHIEKTEVSKVENKDETDVKFPRKDGVIQVSEVIQAGETKQEELYSRARLWFAEVFRDSESVLEMEDKEEGILLGNGILPVIIPSNYSGDQECNLWVTIKIETKEGRYKYTINNMKYSTPVYDQTRLEDMYVKEKMPKFFRNYRVEAINELRYLVGSLMDHMENASENESEKW